MSGYSLNLANTMLSCGSQYPTPWLGPSWNPGAGTRLFCFPHAGGGTSAYRQWQGHVSPGVEILAVALPGRESRIGEPPIDAMNVLVQRLCAALIPYLDRPFAFFGHSMGALLAYEVMRSVHRLRGRWAKGLFVSAKGAPQLIRMREPRHLMADARLREEVLKYGGVPEEVLGCEDLMELLVTTLRADLRAVETYKHSHQAPLEVATMAFAGQNDVEVRPESVRAWAAVCPRSFECKSFVGGHFFVREHVADVLSLIESRLGGVTA